MDRPISIVKFERCYLAAFAVGVVNTLLSWSATQQRIADSGAAEMYGAWFLPVTTLIGFAITLLLWYGIARRGSTIAKWIATVFFALAIVGLLVAVPMGNYPHGLGGVLGIVSTVLQGVAIWLIFRPDTRAWFGETGVAA